MIWMNVAPDDPPSPCTGICRVSESSGVCDGCCRTLEEIAGWTFYSPAEKCAVLLRVEERRVRLGVAPRR